MLEWILENIFTTAGITTSNIYVLLGYYLLYFITGFLCMLPVHAVFKEVDTEELIPVSRAGLLVIFIFTIIEELLFRGVPLFLLGAWALLPAHILLALLHKHPVRIAFAGISLIFTLRLWLGGSPLLAILFHLGHNMFIIMLFSVIAYDKGRETKF